MTPIEDRILSYASLSAAERNEVQVYVNANPEWYPLLNEVRHLTSAMPLPAETAAAPEDALLAYYLTATHIEPFGSWSPELRRAFRRLEDRLEKDPELADRARVFRRRIQEAEASVDPVEQFESLPTPSMTSSPSPSAPEDATADDDPSPDRGRVLSWVARWPDAVQWGFAVFLIGALLYGAAWGIDRMTRSPLDRLAALDMSETRIEGYRVNVPDSVAAEGDSLSTDRLFLQALGSLREARTTTLGLFPRYADRPLDASMSLLRDVVDREPTGSFLGLEARFFLAKAHLAQDDPEAARRHLQVLARRDNRRAAEAVRLLQDLQAVAPVAEPDAPASPYD